MKLHEYTESLNVSYRIYITTVTFIAFSKEPVLQWMLKICMHALQGKLKTFGNWISQSPVLFGVSSQRLPLPLYFVMWTYQVGQKIAITILHEK